MRMKDIKADGVTKYAYQGTASYDKNRMGQKVVVLDKGLRRIVSGDWQSRLSDTEDGVLIQFVDGTTQGFRRRVDTRKPVPKDRPGARGSVFARYEELPEDQLIVQAREIAGEWAEHEALYRAQEVAAARRREAEAEVRRRDQARVEVLKEALGADGISRTRYGFELSREAVDAVIERLGLEIQEG